MKPRLDAIGLVVSDLRASIAFYRRLGIEFPGQDENGHAEAALPGGIRLMLDTIELVKSFDPGWTQPSGGHRIALAFLCDSPADVDRLYQTLVNGRLQVVVNFPKAIEFCRHGRPLLIEPLEFGFRPLAPRLKDHVRLEVWAGTR